jgi:hypothetical protein
MHLNKKIRLVSNNWIRGSYKDLTDYYINILDIKLII